MQRSRRDLTPNAWDRAAVGAPSCQHPERYGGTFGDEQEPVDICMGCGEVRRSGSIVGEAPRPAVWNYHEARIAMLRVLEAAP